MDETQADTIYTTYRTAIKSVNRMFTHKNRGQNVYSFYS